MTFTQSESTAAARRFPVYLVDATDGLTAETGEAGGQPQISKNGGAFGNTSATLTAIGNGSYYVELTTGELDTLGTIRVRYKSANTAEFAMSADVKVAPMASYTQPTGFLAATFPTTVASTTNITAGTITTATNVTTVNGLAANVITAASIESNAITSAKIATDAIGAAQIAANAITSAKIAGSAITSTQIAPTAIGVTQIADGALSAAKFDTGALNGKGDWLLSSGYTAPPSAATISTAVWSEATRTITGGTISTVSDKTGYSLATAPPTTAAIADAVWDEVLSGHLTAGSTGNALNASGSAGDPWSTALPGAYGSGTAGNIIGNANTRFLTMIELDGSVYRYTTNALEMGPAGEGGGGGATTEEIVAALAGKTVAVTPLVDEERGEFTIVEGEEKTLSFSITGWTGASLDGQTISLRIVDRLTYDTDGTTANADAIGTGTSTQSGQTVSVSITITDTQTAALTPTSPPVPGFTHVAQLWSPSPERVKTYNVKVERGIRSAS